MGVLSRALVIAALTGCYSPSVKDCVLPCGSAADCADGQSCSAEGTCAAPAVTCNGGAPIDAPGMIAPHDATLDAPNGTVPVTVEINGIGSVQLMGSGAVGMQMCEDDRRQQHELHARARAGEDGDGDGDGEGARSIHDVDVARVRPVR